jgi:hypothetical protein
MVMKKVFMSMLEWLLVEKVWGFCWKYVIKEEDKWECICDSMGNWRRKIRDNWYVYRGVDGVYCMINNK